MEKQKKLSETLRKTIIQETVGSNFASFLNKAETTRDVRAILNLMIKKLITEKGVPYIGIEDYIKFFSKIPLKHWATRPIFYFRHEKWDALGFLGERVHQSTLITKTLDFYYQDVLNYCVTSVMDNEEPMFQHITNPKERMIASLTYLQETATKGQLNRAYHKAKRIMNGIYY